MAKKASKIPPKTKEVKLVPEELQQQMQAIRACATAFALVQDGSYHHTKLESVRASLGFLAKLHEQSMDVALSHPQAHMIEDEEFKQALKDTKEQTKAKKAVASVEAQAEH